MGRAELVAGVRIRIAPQGRRLSRHCSPERRALCAARGSDGRTGSHRPRLAHRRRGHGRGRDRRRLLGSAALGFWFGRVRPRHCCRGTPSVAVVARADRVGVGEQPRVLPAGVVVAVGGRRGQRPRRPGLAGAYRSLRVPPGRWTRAGRREPPRSSAADLSFDGAGPPRGARASRRVAVAELPRQPRPPGADRRRRSRCRTRPRGAAGPKLFLWVRSLCSGC